VRDRAGTNSPVPDSIDNISDELLSGEHRKIVNIEKNKGWVINALQAQRILSFIYDYARFIIQLNISAGRLSMHIKS
jgi:hypothetical protein